MNPLTLFRARTDVERLQVRPASQAPVANSAGMVERRRKEIIAYLPDAASATGRTIRLHEADHLAYSPNRPRKPLPYHPMAVQAVEDARISQLEVWCRRPTSVKRDAAAAALRDWKAAVKAYKVIKQHPELGAEMLVRAHNLMMVCAMRDYAILYRMALNEKATRIHTLLTVLVGKLLGNTAIGAARNASTNANRPTTKQWQEELRRALQYADSVMMRLPAAASEGHSNDYKHGDISHGQEKAGARRRMVIYEPERPVPCDALGFDITPSATGSILRLRGMIDAAIGAPPSNLCQRVVDTRRGQGTVVVIDGSGSMHMDNEKLQTLCLAIPYGTVAYYSDWTGANDVMGTLVVWSKDGYRATKIVRHAGGNSVDLQALTWLLEQPGTDKYLVTDRGFCGGNTGDCAKGLTLLSLAEAMGQVQVIDKADTAIAYFQQIGKSV